MPKFVLLLGTQKGGSTWFYDNLTRHPDFESAGMKEWRSLYWLPLEKDHIEFTQRENIFYVEEKFWNQLSTKKKRKFARTSFSHYLSVMHSSARWNPSVQAVGDGTPSSTGKMSAEKLIYIRKQLMHLDFEIKPFFFMRDPVKRHISMCKMRYVKYKKRGNFDSYLISELQHIKAGNSRYEKIIPVVENVFPNIFFAFSENMQKYPAMYMNDFWDFIGITRLPEDSLINSSNPAKIKFDISESVISQLRSSFEKTYEFCVERFNPNLPSSWMI